MATKKSKVNEFMQGKTEILKTFTTKGYKSWTAREGVGAQTTLYKDGKIVGLCTDEGNGGEVDFRANTVEDRTMVFEFVKSLPKYKFNDYWKEQYGEEWDGKGKSELKSWTVFDFANIILEQAEEEKQLKKECKKNILVRFEGETSLRVFNAKWPKDTYGQLMTMSQLIKQSQPKVIAEFINKRFA